MKSKPLALIILLAVVSLLLYGCGSDAPETSSHTMVGGYTEDRELTPDDLEIFVAPLTEEQLATYEPLTVATQVVAGTNYRFYCSVMVNGQASDEYAYVYIFKPLDPDEGPTLTEIVDI